VLRQYHAVLGELIPAVLSNDPVPVDRHELEAVRLALAAPAAILRHGGGVAEAGHACPRVAA
jgi:hypothetical protein